MQLSHPHNPRDNPNVMDAEYDFESGTTMEDHLNVLGTRVPEVKVERKVIQRIHPSRISRWVILCAISSVANEGVVKQNINNMLSDNSVKNEKRKGGNTHAVLQDFKRYHWHHVTKHAKPLDSNMQELEDIIVSAQGKVKYFLLKLVWKILLHGMFWVLSIFP
ncbi:hypothetical protein SCLCIDRAFT_9547 [Scleroderma citrinum Foug A]|uniref:Uncharacterized protein n=1 Tax=Scleroderma citrinum Foug A TaxID=1036808 RepID=A0A0C3DXH9_9AGAM|nr:hypothetical protein SCLCIDRAFT_9547 [Scleroderma citrinum Foug A]